MRGKKTGGRSKGTRNKATQALRDAVASTGLSPQEIMIDNMRHAYSQALEVEANLGAEMLKGTEDPQEQFKRILGEVKRAIGFRQIAQECAKDAAPYVHPRLASTEVTGKDGGPLVIEVQKFAADQDSEQLAAPELSAQGLALPGKGREASVLSLASPQRKG